MTNYATIPLRIQDQGGRAIPNATVLVRTFNTANPAPIYAPNDPADPPAPLTQPLLTDGNGYCFFALAEGVRVDIEVSGPGLASQVFPGLMAVVAGGGGGGGAWGTITGTLSNQTDLQAALDAIMTFAMGRADANTVISCLGLLAGGGNLSGPMDIDSFMAAGRLVGRGAASGSGRFEEIILGSNLSMSGNTLNAAAASPPGADIFNYYNFA